PARLQRLRSGFRVTFLRRSRETFGEPHSGGRMNRFVIAVAFLVAASSAAFAQSDPVFDENTVATYRITMNAAEWDMIVNDPSGTGVTWKRCTFEWQGETITDVAIRASRTYNPGAVKPTVRFKFDEFVVDRRWRDLDALKLDSMVGNTDPTMM